MLKEYSVMQFIIYLKSCIMIIVSVKKMFQKVHIDSVSQKGRKLGFDGSYKRKLEERVGIVRHYFHVTFTT